MATDDVQRLKSKVIKYCGKCRNPALPLFEISRLYDLQTEWKSTEFPYSDDHGCYVFYSETYKLLYIGKASLKHALGARIAGYFRWNIERETLVADGEWKPSPPRFLQTVKVNEAFEAPSLEEYLLRELDPPANSRK